MQKVQTNAEGPAVLDNWAFAFGTSERARTFDPRIKNPLLYQLSYGGRLWGGDSSDPTSPMQASVQLSI